MQEVPNSDYIAREPTHPCSIESISLDAGIGLHNGAGEASGAAVEGSNHSPAVPTVYPLDLSPLLEAILQMRNSQLEFQWMMLENGSTSSRMHMAVEDAPPPTPPALPHVTTPSTGPSVPWEALEVPCLRLILPSPPSHISYAMLPVASHSPFAMPNRC